MLYQLEYRVAGIVWQNGSVEWVDKTQELNASTDEEALTKAKAILFDEGSGSYTPRIKKLSEVHQKVKAREVSIRD